ncbi:MAG: GreA/GreB family elongation factor [Meiothermus sp.]|nr:GreA/GreB family elongation factor [Meiothermus sp.]
MSRAFVKEDSSGQDITIPARAPLPEGTPNYVTPRGLGLLEAEREALLAELSQAQGDPATTALAQGKLELLEERLSSAKLVKPEIAPQGQVGIGSTVTLLTDGKERRLTIVGVDEADALSGRVAFISPIAQVLIGHSVGDEVSLKTARGTQTLKIVEVEIGAA